MKAAISLSDENTHVTTSVTLLSALKNLNISPTFPFTFGVTALLNNLAWICSFLLRD
jgi:hypothetical protein